MAGRPARCGAQRRPSEEGTGEWASGSGGLRSRQRARRARSPEPGTRALRSKLSKQREAGCAAQREGVSGENGRAGPVWMVPAAGPGEPRAVLATGLL